MSFSSGFFDGFNYYTKLADIDRKDKLAESQLETEKLRRESYQSTIDFNEERLKLQRTTPAELDQIPEEERTFSQLDLIADRKIKAWNLDKAKVDLGTSKINNETAQANLDNTLATIEDENERKAVETIVNIYQRLSNGDVNPTVAASILEEPFMVLREGGIYDFTKYGDENYVRGWERIAPKLESGDLESIATNDADVLTNIFKERLDLFKGKSFVSADGRKGKIESVSLDGTFDGIANSSNMLVGGSFNVKFDGDEETTEVFSYLPDNARSLTEIKEDKTSDDAKVVSVADIVDRVSAEKEFMMHAINNPSVMRTIIAASKGAVNYKGDSKLIEQMAKTHFDLKEKGETYIGTVENNAQKAKLAAQKDLGNPDSAYYGSLFNQEPEIASEFIETSTDEFGETLYTLIDGVTLDGFRDKLVEKYANPQKIYAQVSSAYSTYDNLLDRSNGRPAFHFYKGEHFLFDTSKEELDTSLRSKIPNYDSVKAQAGEAFEALYGTGSFENADPEQYLSFMTAYLTRLGI